MLDRLLDETGTGWYLLEDGSGVLLKDFTVFFTCGGECDLTHWNAHDATVTIESTIRRSGTGSVKIAATSAANATIRAGGLSASGHVVERVAINFGASLPATDAKLLYVGGAVRNAYIGFDQAAGKLAAFGQNDWATRAVSSVVVANTWYVVDVHFDGTPTLPTIDWRVDGVAQAQTVASAGGPTTYSNAFLGQIDDSDNPVLATFTAYYDDFAISKTASDYPIRDGESLGAPEVWTIAAFLRNSDVFQAVKRAQR